MFHLAFVRRWHVPIIVIGTLFLALSVLRIDDFGMTWDEPATFAASRANVQPLFDWLGTRSVSCDEIETGVAESVSVAHLSDWRAFPDSYHRLPGYYFVFDTMRGLFVATAETVHADANLVQRHHLFNICVATGCIVSLYNLVFEVSRNVRLAALAALSLALVPQFVGHSQNNPKDLPGVFVYLLTSWLVVRATLVPRRLNVVLAAITLGLSLTTHVVSVFLVEILVLWLAVRWPRRAETCWKQYLAMLGGGCLVAFACWPWLWNNPAEKLPVIVRRLSNWHPFQVLYLGEIRDWGQLPWHYFTVHLTASMPLFFLGLMFVALVSLLGRRPEDVRKRDAAWLGVIWVGLLLLVEPLSPRQYDGIRHFLVILPGIAMLIAVGADVVIGAATRRAHSGQRAAMAMVWLACTGVAGGYAMTFMELARMHPYETAYLNQAANWLGGPDTEEWLEVEYWGNAYREGADWLNENAEADAEVCVPLADHIARVYAKRTVHPWCRPADFEDSTRPKYLMFITRKALFGASGNAVLLARVQAEYEPVFTIRRQRATLLKVYRNRYDAHAVFPMEFSDK